MVAKGLDFHNVTFVGVLSADLSLYLDDYRSSENTFSMLTQVVGRAGRGSEPGEAIIQTLSPDHEVIRFAAKQDFDGFYQNEIALRRQMGYPPFFDLCVLTLSGVFENHVQQAVQMIAAALRGAFAKHKEYIQANLLGPAPAPIVRLSNKYRYRIVIKCRNDKNFRLLLASFISHFASQRGNKNYILTVDINPYNML
jgi:primosomal protein N' (replication factor Y)